MEQNRVRFWDRISGTSLSKDLLPYGARIKAYSDDALAVIETRRLKVAWNILKQVMFLI